MRIFKSRVISIIVAMAIIIGFCIAPGFTSHAAGPYNFSKVGGGTISSTPASGKKLNVILFGRPTCGNCQYTLSGINKCDSLDNKDVQFIYADIDGNDESTISKEAKNFSDKIIFCYGDNNAASWKLSGLTGSITLPIVVYIDENGKTVKATTGSQSGSEIDKIVTKILNGESLDDGNESDDSDCSDESCDTDYQDGSQGSGSNYTTITVDVTKVGDDYIVCDDGYRWGTSYSNTYASTQMESTADTNVKVTYNMADVTEDNLDCSAQATLSVYEVTSIDPDTGRMNGMLLFSTKINTSNCSANQTVDFSLVDEKARCFGMLDLPIADSDYVVQLPFDCTRYNNKIYFNTMITDTDDDCADGSCDVNNDSDDDCADGSCDVNDGSGDDCADGNCDINDGTENGSNNGSKNDSNSGSANSSGSDCADGNCDVNDGTGNGSNNGSNSGTTNGSANTGNSGKDGNANSTNGSAGQTNLPYSNEWINGEWYDANGQKTYNGTLLWKSNSTGWWVEDTAGWFPKNSWQKIDGAWYYFKPDGYMASGEYYNGYWFNSNGSWDSTYFLTWKSNSSGWWVEDKSGWWPSARWMKIDGSWYYFNGSGYMATNQYVDGYWIGSNGVCQ